MAETKITDVIDPEVLSDVIINKLKDKIIQLPGVFRTNDFPIGSKGTIFEIPYATELGDLETLIEGTPLTAQGTTQDKCRAVVIRKAGVYSATKIMQIAAYKDPTEYFSTQFVKLINKTMMKTQLNILDGALVVANQEDGSGAAISTAVIYAAKQKLGDQAADLKYCLMHSAKFSILENAGEIIYQPASQILPLAVPTNKNQVEIAAAGSVPTIAGLIVIQSDNCTITTGTPDVYHTYLLGNECMGLFYQKNVEIELDKSVFDKESYISPDLHFAMTLMGVDYTSTSYTVANLKNSANYTLKWNQKLVKAVSLLTQ